MRDAIFLDNQVKEESGFKLMHYSWVALTENIDLLAWHIIKPPFTDNLSEIIEEILNPQKKRLMSQMSPLLLMV